MDLNENKNSTEGAEETAEKRILEAAIEEFTSKGYDRARMQSIADKADISKSALHYYYRHKERLFKAVLDESVGKVLQRLKFEVKHEGNFIERLENVFHEYYQALIQNANIVRFLFIEAYHNPELLECFLTEGGYRLWLTDLQDELDKEYAAGRIIKIRAEQLILNLVSLCLYPHIAKPLIRKILGKTEPEYNELVGERESLILDVLVKSLMVSNKD